MRPEGLRQRGAGADRRRQQHGVGAGHRGRRVAREPIDDATLASQPQVGLAAPEADHLADQAGLARRQRERAADESHARDGEPGEERRHAADAQDRLQRLDEAVVLLGQPDRDPQVLRQPVAVHRAHDDALAQQAPRTPRGPARHAPG